MAEFDYSNVGKPTSAVKQQEQVQPTDVVFVEKGKWDGSPICYCCVKRHKGRWWECPKASNKEKSKTADMVGFGHFYLRTVKKWDNIHKNTTPKVKKEVVQDAVEEYSKSNDEDKETVLPSYAHLIKANGFVNISVHGDANREESGSFDRDAVSEFGIGCLQIDEVSLPGTTSHDQPRPICDFF